MNETDKSMPIAVKDSETEIVQKKARCLVQEAKLRVDRENYEEYLKYINAFAEEQLKRNASEIANLSAEEIKAIDFLMAPKAKKLVKICTSVSLAGSGVAFALAIWLSPAFLAFLLLFAIPLGVMVDTLFFLIPRKRALEYLTQNEDEENKIKTED